MTQNQSPLPTQVKSPEIVKIEPDKILFDFPTAIKKVSEGKKVSKEEWKNTKIYGLLKDERLMIHKEDKTDHAWIISTGDLTGTDWFVVK